MYKDLAKKEKRRERSLKYKFGITLEHYNAMFNAQEGRCKICSRHQTELGKTLAVDHCYITHKVRGLLCDFCNRQLGVYERRPDLFYRFDTYLKENT